MKSPICTKITDSQLSDFIVTWFSDYWEKEFVVFYSSAWPQLPQVN